MINIQMDKKTAIVAGFAVFSVTLLGLTAIDPTVATKFIDAMAPWARIVVTDGAPT